jgi:hypothetical protein
MRRGGWTIGLGLLLLARVASAQVPPEHPDPEPPQVPVDPNGPPGGPPPGPGGLRGPPGPPPPEEPRGLRVHEAGALPGYTLIAPLQSKTIHLVDLDGNVVHRWKTGFAPGSEYFLEDGHLLRCSKEPVDTRFNAGGQAGRLQEIDWDGNVVWDWKYASQDHMQHHDLVRTPGGTILFIASEWKSREECIAAGRHPAQVGKDGMLLDTVVEIEPKKPDGAEIVWEWHAFDHLVQDLDAEAEKHGNVAEHPELIDFNFDLRIAPASDAKIADMKKLGYIAVAAKPTSADWLHLNAIDYDAEHDQIVLSSPHMSEIWILDHSTTSDEAAGHAGGASGHGGDLLWRFGNPKNYGAGGNAEQRLFGQHNVRWIAKGLPGAGHLLVFNNGEARPDGSYSSVVELEPPRKGAHDFVLEPLVPAGPEKYVWEYKSPDPKEFFSSFISGAQRLSNGNTLICEGARGRVFEVTPDGKIVWDFLHALGALDPAPRQQPAPQNALFRATRIPADHPGLKGRELKPLQ